MTTNHRLEWRTVCLMFFLSVCQTAWRVVEGHPYNQERSWVDPQSLKLQESQNISMLIESAYENDELLSPNRWSRNNNVAMLGSSQRNVNRHTSASVTSPASKQGLRKILGIREDSIVMQSDGKIVFPTDDDMPHQTQPLRNTESAPVCQGATFCENVAHYPEHLVNEAIQRNSSLRYLASVDAVSDIVQRIDVSDETPLCISSEQIVFPKSAESKHKKWMYVLNHNNFTQGVRIEICNSEAHQCSLIDFPEGYQAICKQKYIYRQLVAVGNNGTIVSDMFRFPSSCCCHVKFSGEPFLRIGTHVGERSNQSRMMKQSTSTQSRSMK